MKERKVLVGVTLPRTPNKSKKTLALTTCNKQRARWMCSALRNNKHSKQQGHRSKKKNNNNNDGSGDGTNNTTDTDISNGGGGGIGAMLKNEITNDQKKRKPKDRNHHHNTHVVLYWEWFRPLLWHQPIDVAAAFTYIERNRFLSKLTAYDLSKPFSSSKKDHHKHKANNRNSNNGIKSKRSASRVSSSSSRSSNGGDNGKSGVISGDNLILDWVRWSNQVVNWAREVQLYCNDLTGLNFLIEIANHCLDAQNYNTVSLILYSCMLKYFMRLHTWVFFLFLFDSIYIPPIIKMHIIKNKNKI